MKQKKLCWQ